MFCPHCGTSQEENAAFCSECGASLRDPVPTKKRKKTELLLVVAIVAAIIAAVLIMNVTSVNSSPEKVAIAAIESEYEADIDKMIKCFPDFTLREIALDYDLSSNASRTEIKNKLKEEYRYNTSEKVTNARAEVISTHSPSDISSFWVKDDITDEEFDTLQEIARVRVDFTVDGDEKSIQVFCVKMENKWYLLRSRL